MISQRHAAVPAYREKDGSEIRDLVHPDVHGNRAQSLAETTVPAGSRTLLHRHHRSEELYHITAGQGRMTLGPECFAVHPGDTILIPPGTAHCIEAIGQGTPAPAVLLCARLQPWGHGTAR
jgi:mannose-6-phosphate isomerase-like protein (cupin superfamily)